MSSRKDQLSRYPLALFDLIPLNRPNATKTLPSGKVMQMGKAPLHSKWTIKKYDSKAVRDSAIEEKRNVGVRLKADQLVIDIDPRNGGEAGFAALCHDIGFDPDPFPRVVTGSGGLHIYMSKPADLLVVDTLPGDDYAGVEFKSKGRQVVAAGSIHPNGKPYLWSEDHPRITDNKLPRVPKALLNIIKRPPRSAVAGGGQYEPHQIAEILDKLDVRDYDTNDKWLRLMMAIHHASAGEARSEFLEWSAGDPNYAAEIYMMGKRWDSLHADKHDGITYKSLNQIMRNNGIAALQVPTVADDEFPDDIPPEPLNRKKQVKPAKADSDTGGADFEDDGDDWLDTNAPEPEEDDDDWLEDGVTDEGYNAEARGILDRLNKRYVAVMEGGKFKIMGLYTDPEIGNRRYWVTTDRHSFEAMYCNRRLERDTTGMSRNAANTVPLGEAWMTWPERRTVEGVIFEPDSSIGERDGYLNLWTGFHYEPHARLGTWDRMQEMLFEITCSGNKQLHDYVMNWLALMFQQPTKVPGTALVFRGEQGIGKGLVGNAIAKLVGTHAIAIGDPEQLTGRFNAHMRNLIFLFADEAVAAYANKTAENKLKNLLTEPTLQIEKKGVDIIRVRNLLHVMMATNEKWAVHAGEDERRFVVNEVSNKWKGKFSKFKAVIEELEKNDGGGFKRMLFDLLRHPIPEHWQPGRFPVTKALVEQKILSMSPVKRYWHNMLEERGIRFAIHSGDWRSGPVRFVLQDFRDDFNMWCRTNNINSGSMGRATHSLLMAEVKALFPSAETNLRLPMDASGEDAVHYQKTIDGMVIGLEIPSINVCFREFEKACGLHEGSLGNVEEESSEWG